jgi:hypothetical protein
MSAGIIFPDLKLCDGCYFCVELLIQDSDFLRKKLKLCDLFFLF